MGYFNYFIKCLIRNFAYQASKPKVWVTVLLAIQVAYLISINADVGNLKNSLTQIQNQLSAVQNNQATIATQINDLYKQMETLNTNILNIYNTLEENQKELLDELKSENEKVLNELEELKNILQGVSEDTTRTIIINKYGYATPSLNSIKSSGQFTISTSSTNFGYGTFSYTFEKGYTYTFSCNHNSSSASSTIYYTYDTIANGSTIYAYYLGVYTMSSANFSITPIKNGTITFLFHNPAAFVSSGTSWTISKVSSSSLSSIGSTIDQGNQLQQEQNQLQQEQNDFLKDDNVSADSSTLPTDTTEDITSDGFNNIFNQLYTTFTSGSAKDVVITIPFTNKSFIINSSTVYGGANLGFIKTLIEMFWYFVISYFIVQDVGNKINKIKSGDIEHVQDNNIKEDLL